MTLADVPEWAHVAPGTWDLRVLTQGTWWVDRQARVWRLADMSTAHLQGVLDMLFSIATGLHLNAMVDVLLEGALDLTSLGAEAIAREAGAGITDVAPDAYLESTELVRAIRRELTRR